MSSTAVAREPRRANTSSAASRMRWWRAWLRCCSPVMLIHSSSKQTDASVCFEYTVLAQGDGPLLDVVPGLQHLGFFHAAWWAQCATAHVGVVAPAAGGRRSRPSRDS